MASLPTCAKCYRNGLEDLQYKELLASLRIAQHVKSLQRIEWDSCLFVSADASQVKKEVAVQSVEGAEEVGLLVSEVATSGNTHASGSVNAEGGVGQGQREPKPGEDKLWDLARKRVGKKDFRIPIDVIRQDKRVRVQRVLDASELESP